MDIGLRFMLLGSKQMDAGHILEIDRLIQKIQIPGWIRVREMLFYICQLVSLVRSYQAKAQ